MTLEEAMEAKGFTDASLAKRVGVSRPFITRIKNGKRTPSLKVAAEIEKATGIPAAELVGVAA